MRTQIRGAAALLALAGLAACGTTNDVVRFSARSAQQQALMRDGESIITSRGRLSVVTLRPATRQVVNGRDRNADLATRVASQGAANLQALDTLAIKDNTLLPGETYGGRLVLQGPEAGNSPSRNYTLVMPVGPDVHEFAISQGPAI